MVGILITLLVVLSMKLNEIFAILIGVVALFSQLVAIIVFFYSQKFRLSALESRLDRLEADTLPMMHDTHNATVKQFTASNIELKDNIQAVSKQLDLLILEFTLHKKVINKL